MNILAFDTATSACTVALLAHGEIRERFEIAPQRHAELILPMIDELLKEAGISLRQLDAIAVGQGPGSFMGVRIAIGIAQGLAFGADLPVIPISTLQILAQTAYQQTHRPDIIAGWDARMLAIYWGIYRLGDHQIMRSVQKDALNPPHELKIPDPFDGLLAGNAWQIYRSSLSLPSSVEILDIYPHARAIIPIAEILYREGKVQTPLEIEPVYLRNLDLDRRSGH